MHRFFLPPESCRSSALRLDGREAHHALHVLRLKGGERVTLLDGAGNEFLCDVESTTKDSLTLSVREKHFHPSPPCPVSLFVAIPKGKIIEDIIEKAVELGAHRIVPLLTERVMTQLDAVGAEHKPARSSVEADGVVREVELFEEEPEILQGRGDHPIGDLFGADFQQEG